MCIHFGCFLFEVIGPGLLDVVTVGYDGLDVCIFLKDVE